MRVFNNIFKYLNLVFNKEVILISSLLSIIFIIIIPLPTVILDFFLSISLMVGLIIFILSIYTKQPSSLTMFPSIILLVTLFRLTLNVATTRAILSEGHNGPDQVSSMISAFGEFVVGGNMVIGVIIFLILVLINFIVITKGSTRVAEVSARFNLDSMPGKQMAIDADLNAGFIDDKEAQKKRDDLIKESNFYGSMDGSAKFVQGDAIAGIIITLINIIGGFLLGVFQYDLSVSDSASTYTILTIGDGLIAQIPALIISTGTGIIITRSSKDNMSIASGAIGQIANEYSIFNITSFVLFIFAFIPGFPTQSLLFLSFVMFITSINIYKSAGLVGDNIIFDFILDFYHKNKKSFFKFNEAEKEESLKNEKPLSFENNKPDELEEEFKDTVNLEELLSPKVLELRVGYLLTDIVKSNEFLKKIQLMRTELAKNIGFVIPIISLSVEDNLNPDEYQLLLKGNEMIEGRIETGKLLAIPAEEDCNPLPNAIETLEPVQKIKSYWISPEIEDEAIINNYIVIDAPSIISTHVIETIKKTSNEIITRQDIVSILDRFKVDFPVIINDVLSVASHGLILKVFKDLLRENIPIKDIITILESISDIAEYEKDTEVISEIVRTRLFRTISRQFMDSKTQTLKIITFEPTTEQKMISSLKDTGSGLKLSLNISNIKTIIENTKDALEDIRKAGYYGNLVLIVDPSLRRELFELFNQFDVDLNVVSHSEMDSKIPFDIKSTIKVF